jgi:hypothetical protein
VIDWFAPETLTRFTQPGAYPMDPTAGRVFYERNVARFEPVDESQCPHVLRTDVVSWRDALEGLVCDLGI